MLLTTGEAITRTLRFEQNQGTDLIYDRDPELREKALHRLELIVERVDTLAPYFWRLADGTVVLSSGVGSTPTDFSSFGESGRVYVQGTNREVHYIPPDDLETLLVQDSGVQSEPLRYTLKGKTVLGRAQIKTYPASNATLLLKNYIRRCPDLFDYPVAPAAAEGSAGAISGSAYTYRASFVHANGETEGGGVSITPLTVSSKRVNLTQVATSPSRLVTARKIWRPASAGVQYKLVGTISDNLTTTFEDNIADGSLGANMTTPAEAVSGLELFPENFHRGVFVDGLAMRFMQGQGDERAFLFSDKWERHIKRIWEEHQQGQNVPHVMPRYGSQARTYRRPRIAS